MTSQILFLRNRMIHVPSVASYHVYKSLFLRLPVLELTFHHGGQRDLVYPMNLLAGWQELEADVRKLQSAMDTVYQALHTVPALEQQKLQ